MSSARRALGAAALTLSGFAVALGSGVSAAPITVHEVYPVPPSGSFTLDGHGYGHGHGMSQFGAYGAAEKGLTYSQIVGFYSRTRGFRFASFFSPPIYGDRSLAVSLGGSDSQSVVVLSVILVTSAKVKEKTVAEELPAVEAAGD